VVFYRDSCIFHCMKHLLMEQNEGSHECSCELLKTEGKGLENENRDLSGEGRLK
jgi:hypothetical protein